MGRLEGGWGATGVHRSQHALVEIYLNNPSKIHK